MNPQMSRKYLTNDRILGYPCLPHPLFTGTMIAGTVSNHRNNNAQVYVTSFGWTRLFPIKLKSDDYDTFLLFFNSNGVWPEKIMDIFKEHLSSYFVRSCVRLTAIRRQSNITHLGA